MVKLQRAAVICCLFLILSCNADSDDDQTVVAQTATTVRIAQGLDEPIGLFSAPGDSSRLYVIERAGKIRVVEDSQLLAAPYLDLSNLVETGFGEQGLLGLAFHPQFAENGFLFVNYSRSGDGSTIIARYTGGADQANPASAEIVLTVDQPYENHNGGMLLFGPDGNLWIGMGDGGSAGDPQGNAQNPNSLLGKMLRVNVNQLPYTIPEGNAFPGGEGGRPEIWAMGLRNPWRYDFDPQTGDLYIADVGQNTYEWIHVAPEGSGGGLNFGWNITEGDHCFPPESEPCERDGLQRPVYEYRHTEGCSITGGIVYRGCALPDLAGHYVFADYCNNWIRSFRWQGGGIVGLTERTTEWRPAEGALSNISSFGRDAAGEFYICCHFSGEVYKLVPSDLQDANHNFVHDPCEE